MMYSGLRLKKIDFLIITIILVSAIYIYYHLIDRDPLVIGVDAPYYMIQVREILRSGSMKYGDPPLTFYILYAIAYVVNDVRLGFIIGASILAASASIPFYMLIKEVTGKYIPAITTILLILYSPLYLRMLADFVKNQFGIVFIGLVMIYLFKDGKTSRDYILIFLFTLLAGLTHILDFALILIILGGYTLISLLGRDREWRMVLLIAIVSITIYYVGYLLNPFYFGDLNRGFGFISDITSSEENIRRTPSITMYIPGITALFLSIILIGYKLYKNDYNIKFLFSIAILDLFLIIPWNSNWVYRFLIMTFLPSSLILGYIVSLVENRFNMLLISLVIFTMPISNTLMTINHLHPTINMLEYNDFTAIGNMIESNSIIVFKESLIKRYWAEYILNHEIYSRIPHIPGLSTIYIIVRNDGIGPPHAKLLYHGSVYSLYILKI